MRCIWCDVGLVPSHEWKLMSVEQRKGLALGSGGEICSTCRARKKRGSVPEYNFNLPLMRTDETLLCRDDSVEPDWWFSDVPEDLALAQSICGQCPARGTCRDGAIERKEHWGIWGGVMMKGGKPARVHVPIKATHCGRGHEYTPENTVPATPGHGRSCRMCKRALDQARREAA